MIEHREALDCPCFPETRRQVGGGSVLVHRPDAPERAGRQEPSDHAPDRYCSRCSSWHLLGHPHLDESP